MKEIIEKVSQIKDYQEYLNALYSDANEKLIFEEIYSYLVRSSGYLCKNIANKQNKEEDFLKSISWLFALASKVEIDLQDAFLSRYPQICPYCVSNPCICFRTGKTPRNYMPAYKIDDELYYSKEGIKNSKSIVNFEFCIENINSIYPNNEIIWFFAGPWHHFSKIQEEISEVQEAFIKFKKGEKNLNSLAGEMADVLAWILSAWNILSIKNPVKKSLDEEFKNYYYKGCPVCRNKPCNCSKYSSRYEGLIDINSLLQIKDDLEVLKEELPGKKAELEELLKSIKVATENQNEPTARISIKQVAEKMEVFKNAVSSTDITGLKILSILDTIHKLGNLLT